MKEKLRKRKFFGVISGENHEKRPEPKRNVNSDNEKKRDDDREDMDYRSASVVLEVMIDEYSKEFERKDRLDNKAGMMIAVQIAILTFLIPMIPFENIVQGISAEKPTQIVLTVISCIFLVVGIMLMGIAFVVVQGSLKIQTYQNVEVDRLINRDILTRKVDHTKKILCKHYCELIRENAEISNEKAKKYKLGLPLTIISFALLMAGTIFLKLIK